MLGRDEAYIGVMIDDLVTKGVDEPYRMFTSRAEYRLLLREDNADWRLSRYGHELGLLSEEHYTKFEAKKQAIERTREVFADTMIGGSADNETFLQDHGCGTASNGVTLEGLLRRPEVDIDTLRPVVDEFVPDLDLDALSDEVLEALEIQVKYEGYINRQLEQVDKHREMEKRRIPGDMDFAEIHGLSNEVRQKLGDVQPATVGQASRINGMTPAAISALLIHLKKSA